MDIEVCRSMGWRLRLSGNLSFKHPFVSGDQVSVVQALRAD
jgi:hypothetical protein